jgi:hypothetical protein
LPGRLLNQEFVPEVERGEFADDQTQFERALCRYSRVHMGIGMRMAAWAWCRCQRRQPYQAFSQ